jgi:peptidoglycan/LPS O-acetylase OafA/YrhL
MSPKGRALAGLLLAAAADGMLGVIFDESKPAAHATSDLATSIVAIGFMFMWVHYDSIERGYRRSALLSIGIVALALVFLPAYLVKSRPPGERLRAFFGLAVIVLLMALAEWIAGSITALLLA